MSKTILFNGECLDVMASYDFARIIKGRKACIVTDPPFNIGYHYKNPTDKRIKARIERGITGGRLYDWWNINQVKNVSKKEIGHPCIMPVEVMERIVGILPEDYIIIDPFLGSGTTGIACKKLGRDFIGIEMDEDYFNIAEQRIFAEEETIIV